MGCLGRIMLILAFVGWLFFGFFTRDWEMVTTSAAWLSLVGYFFYSIEWLAGGLPGGWYGFWRLVCYLSVPIAGLTWGAGASFGTVFWVFTLIVTAGLIGLGGAALGEKWSV